MTNSAQPRNRPWWLEAVQLCDIFSTLIDVDYKETDTCRYKTFRLEIM